MSSPNEDVYARMLKSTFTVNLARDGEELPLQCRHLPFTTLMSIIGEIAVTSSEEIARARRALVEEIMVSGINAVTNDRLNSMVLPVIIASVSQTPELARKVILDCCIGANEETVKLFTVEDTLTVVYEVVRRVDAERVADKLQKVFSMATEIQSIAFKMQSQKDASLTQVQKSPSPSSSEPSPEPVPV